MKEIWTKDVAEFHGEFVELRADLVLAQTGSARISCSCLVRELHGAVLHVDEPPSGWFPRSRNPELVTKRHGRAQDAPRRLGVTCKRSPSPSSGHPVTRAGRHHRDIGATRVILRLPSEGRDTILPMLDQYAVPALKSEASAWARADLLKGGDVPSVDAMGPHHRETWRLRDLALIKT